MSSAASDPQENQPLPKTGWLAWVRVIVRTAEGWRSAWRVLAHSDKPSVVRDRLHVYCAKHGYPDDSSRDKHGWLLEDKPLTDVVSGTLTRAGETPCSRPSAIAPGEFPNPPDQWWSW